jgi:NADH dehydrogenase
VEDGEKILEGMWTAGDVARVPDLSGGGVGGFCVPNAQHAVRQGKILAKNLVAVLRGEEPKQYVHKNLGAVAGLGIGYGVFQSGPFAVTGFLAWIMHRGYHGLAIPTFERKARVFTNWLLHLFWGRDFSSLSRTQRPRDFFEEFASKPKVAAKAKATAAAR